MATRHSPEQQFANSISRNRSSALTSHSQWACLESSSRSLLFEMVFLSLFIIHRSRFTSATFVRGSRTDVLGYHCMFNHCGTILVFVAPAFILIKYFLFADHKGVQESPVFDVTYYCARGLCYEGAMDATRCIISVVGCHGQFLTWYEFE